MFSIRRATELDYPDIQRLIHTTVEACYPAIYAPEVVQFFIQYHSLEEIHRRAASGVVLVLIIEGNIRATGFLSEGEMGGVYVHPGYQRQGLGTYVINNLLEIAQREKLIKICLDATPMAKPLYKKLGFDLISPMIMHIGDKTLHYYKMGKVLS